MPRTSKRVTADLGNNSGGLCATCKAAPVLLSVKSAHERGLCQKCWTKHYKRLKIYKHRTTTSRHYLYCPKCGNERPKAEGMCPCVLTTLRKHPNESQKKFAERKLRWEAWVERSFMPTALRRKTPLPEILKRKDGKHRKPLFYAYFYREVRAKYRIQVAQGSIGPKAATVRLRPGSMVKSRHAILPSF